MTTGRDTSDARPVTREEKGRRVHTHPDNAQSDPAVTFVDLLLHAAIAYRTAWLRLEEQAETSPHTRAQWLARQGLEVAGHTLAQAALRYADAAVAPVQPVGEEES